MTRVRWTPQARDDLHGIHEYICNDSPHYAALVVAELLASVRRLREFPESGRVVPERGEPALREVIWRNYRIVYRHLVDAIESPRDGRSGELLPTTDRRIVFNTRFCRGCARQESLLR